MLERSRGLHGCGAIMQFELGSTLVYDAKDVTTLILNIEAQHLSNQTILSESLLISPEQPTETYTVAETGNRYRRLNLQPGRIEITYRASVETSPDVDLARNIGETAIAELPLEITNHLFPSRYCEADKLARFAWREFGSSEPGFDRVNDVCEWIHRSVDYVPGSSNPTTSAADTFQTRAGVCRDFAHLGITFCRALGIPARYVSAYGWKLEPQDFHAVFEAYLSGRWYLFDATRLVPAGGIIRVGVGRDAADTSFSTFYGPLDSSPKIVWVSGSQNTPAPGVAVSLSAD